MGYGTDRSVTTAAFALAGCGSFAWGMSTATDDAQHTEQIKNVRLSNGSGNVTIRTGRADVVRIRVNGQDRGLLGTPQQTIITKQWDVNGNETIIQ